MTQPAKQDIVIIDEIEPCPYLKGETARMPLRMPLVRMTLHETDLRFAEGNRRTGEFVYQTNCPNCQACEPIRLDCFTYQFSKNCRRVLSRGNRKFEQKIEPLKSDEARISLFNKHRQVRGLASRSSDIDANEYEWGFVRSCFESFEISYYLDGKLVCVGICDRGEHSLSAVYTYFDPDIPRDSLGTYSILKQIEYCRQNEYQYLYLGYYVENSPHMKYKSRFLPHQRLVAGQWRNFEA
jgi:arginine-tRNA-protein transferase